MPRLSTKTWRAGRIGKAKIWVLDADSASEDEEDSEEDISGEEEQSPSDQSDGD